MKRRYIVKTEIDRQRAMDGLKAIDLPAAVTVGPYRRNRSLEQNAMWNGIISVLSDYTGHTDEDLKALIMGELGYTEPKEVLGRLVMVRRSTARMKTDELSELIEKTLAWAASNGLPTLRSET